MMRKANSLFKLLTLVALLVGALMMSGAALADDGIECAEFVLYVDGEGSASNYAVSSSGGYVLNDYMLIDSMSFAINPTCSNTDLSSSEIVSAMESGMREWNSHLARPLFSMSNYVDTGAHASKKNDGVNAISFAELASDVLAVTKTYYNTKYPLPEGYPAKYAAVESDITFNTKYVNWTNVDKNPSGMDLQSLATHELGHALGLGDVYGSQYSYVTMYAYGVSGDKGARSLAEPDLKGLSKFYDVPGYGGPGPLPTLTPAPTIAPTPTPTSALTATVTTTSGGLNMRAEPDKNGAWVATLPRLAKVTVLDRGSEWSKVQYGDKIGYVMSRYLTFDQPIDPSVTPTPTPPERYAYVNASTSLNMREAPESNAGIVTRIPSGKQVRVLGYDSEWSHVQYGVYTGYVATRYLTFMDGQTPEPSATPEPGVTATPEPPSREAIVNTTTRLNMRSDPNMNGDILVRIPARATVKVVGTASEWSKIVYGGQTGYVMTRYLLFKDEPTDAPTAQPSAQPSGCPSDEPTAKPTAEPTAEPTSGSGAKDDYRTVTLSGSARKLNVRQTAAGDAEVIAQVYNGERVRVLAEEGIWSKIEFDGNTGYVKSEYLK
jgi:uncharacterized protein YgiM (DUF1202 family)